MKAIKRTRINDMLRKMFIDKYESIEGAASHYGVSASYLYNIIGGVKPRDDMLSDIGVKREVVKTERFYKLEGEK
jgi:hypothetical protein